MYLEIDEGFPTHRKTLRYCALLQNPDAGWHLVRLWQWACRSAPTGDMTGMEAYDVEMLIGYRLLDGKAFGALISAGWIDRLPDGGLRIHNWMERTGASIEKMDAAADRKKRYRAHAERQSSRVPCPSECEFHKRGADVPAVSQDSPRTNPGQSADGAQDKPTQSSQDKTSPDKTRQDQGDPEKTARAFARPPAPPPAVKASKPPKVPAPDGNLFQQVLDAFGDAWRAKYHGETYDPGPVDRKQLGYSLRTWSPEVIQRLPEVFATYMRDRDPWVEQTQRHSLAFFCTSGGVNKYRTRVAQLSAKEAKGVAAGDQWLEMHGVPDAGR
jgi:hypothetical protein